MTELSKRLVQETTEWQHRVENLEGERAALEGIHFPSTLEHADRARRSLVFQELFLLQVRDHFGVAEWEKRNDEAPI